jgi:hypothetical protein
LVPPLGIKKKEELKMNNNIAEIVYDVHHTKNKTIEQELLLELYNKYANISEICVSESKCHITSSEAVNKIRTIL